MPTTRRLLASVAASAVALCAAAALASPGLAASPPSADTLLAKSSAALKKASSFHIELAAHTSAQGDGSVSAAQLKKTVQPMDVTVGGDLSEKSIVVSGKLTSAGQSLAAELRTDGTQLYVHFMNQWYGAKDLKSASKDSGLSVDLSAKDLTKMLTELMNKGIEAKVTPGPKTDGIETWQVRGEFSAAELSKQLKKSGTTVSSKDVARLADHTTVTFLIGRDDSLPRSIAVLMVLSPGDLASAKTASGGIVPVPSATTKGLKTMTIDIAAHLSKFGDKVQFAAPASFKPLEQMFEALLGGLGSASKGSS